jgi:hypothetical protein
MASVSRNSELACASMTRAAPGSALRSRSTSPARTAAILRWATAGRGAAGNRQGAGLAFSFILPAAACGTHTCWNPHLPPRGRSPRRLKGAKEVEDGLLIRRREAHELRFDRIGFRRRKSRRFR